MARGLIRRWRRRRRQGRYVLWGVRPHALDVQIGSPRDLALSRARQRQAEADRAWSDLMERSKRHACAGGCGRQIMLIEDYCSFCAPACEHWPKCRCPLDQPCAAAL